MAKSEHPFDQNIINILESYSKDTQQDWDLMQHKINEAENDLEFDQKIKQSFQNLHLDSEQISWDQFAAKKNRMLERRKQIIRARIIESLLFLLLLWTVDNIGLTNLLPIKESAPILNSPLALNESVKTNDLTPNLLKSNSLDKLNYNDVETSSDFSQNYKSKLAKGLVPFNQSTTTNTRGIKLKSTILIQNKVLTQVELSSNNINSISDDKSTSNPPSGSATYTSEFRFIAFLPILNQELNLIDKIIHFDELPQIQSLPITKITPLDLKSTWLMGHTGIMLNTIKSPSFLDNGKTYQHQLRPGVQAALSLGMQSKQWMIESGLIYSYLSYEPNMSETLGSFENGYYKIKFDKIQSHIISIPILLHRQILHGTHWNVQAKLGLSISAALKNYFSLDTITNLSGPTHQGLAYGTKDHSVINSRIRSNSNQGLLDGGTIGVNSFVNVVAGIRLNHRLNPRFNLYSELELNSMLGPKKIGDQANGFGPNADRIIATNLNFGIAYKLK